MSGSVAFDPKFYRDFYGLSVADYADDAKLYEFYCAKGKDLGHVANAVELKQRVAALIGFDADVYSQVNLSFDNKPLKAKFSAPPAVGPVAHYVDHYFGEVGGNLYINKRQRLCNTNDLAAFNNVWAAIFCDVDAAVKFDEHFYVSMYDIPAELNTRMAAFMHWLTAGVFMGYVPNASYFAVGKSMVGDINAVLCAHGVDMDYIEKQDGKLMAAYCKDSGIVVPANMSSIAKNLFLFFNAGQKIRIYFNAAECDATQTAHKEMYAAAVKQVKEQPGAFEAMKAKAEAAYAKMAAELKRKELAFKNVAIPAINASQLNSIKMLREIVSADFIECFAKCNGIASAADLKEQVVKLLCQRLMKKATDVDSAEVPAFKEFVLNVVYNMFANDKKKAMSKEEYIKFIKDFAADVLVLLGSKQVRDAIIADLAFLIENKKIIKLGKIAIAVIPTALAFLV